MLKAQAAASLRPAICVFAALLVPAAARASPESAALRAKAADQLFNLDHADALTTFRQAAAADPQDAAAHRGVAAAIWVGITFSRGNIMVDDYLGRVTKPSTTMKPPPADLVAGFRAAIDRALALARQRIAANPRDTDAHYQLGAAVGLRASYAASVDASLRSAFGAAREAFNAHERVLELNPSRRDAGLIVGTYRYVVSALSLPMRWMAYAVGFGGGRERGIQLIENAVAHGGENEFDARLALILLYNREKRYQAALDQLGVLRARYPRNRLLWLESGSTALRAGRWAEADRFLEDGFTRLAADTRPRMFGEEALWHYKIGLTRARLGRQGEAEQALAKAVSLEGRPWVHGRSHIELGRLAQRAGDREGARRHWQTAVRLCESDNDPQSAAEARRLLR
jgi:tetratricopeptide (TPR) repeat protein